MAEAMGWTPGAGPAAKFDAARLFLSDLNVDADMFANPRRSQEWLTTVENLHHALLSLEPQYLALGGSATPPSWLSHGSLGRTFSEFMAAAAGLPAGKLERLDPSCKLALHGALVGALALACADISALMTGNKPD